MRECFGSWKLERMQGHSESQSWMEKGDSDGNGRHRGL